MRLRRMLRRLPLQQKKLQRISQRTSTSSSCRQKEQKVHRRLQLIQRKLLKELEGMHRLQKQKVLRRLRQKPQ